MENIYDGKEDIMNCTLSNTIGLLTVKKRDDQVLLLVYCMSMEATWSSQQDKNQRLSTT
jgi:hypothetical protein